MNDRLESWQACFLVGPLQKKIPIIFWSLLPAWSLLVLLVCFRAGITNRHYDGVAHLNIARRVLDHPQPQLKLLGTVWLPLQHLLLLPLVQIDWFWETGLAGSLISAVSFWAAAFFLYRLSAHFLRSSFLCWITVCLFVLNPNLLYLQTTSLGEVLYLALILGFFCDLASFVDSLQWHNLLRGSIFVALATLTRYDAWFLAVFGGVIILWVGWRRHFEFGFLFRRALAYGLLAASGIMSWFFYNAWALQDLTAFAKGEYATQTRIGRILAEAGLSQYPPYHNPVLAWNYYWEAVRISSGSILLWMGILGFLFFLPRQFNTNRWLIGGLLFLFPPAFYIYNLLRGTGIIYVPALPPFGILNVRYTALFLPALCLMAPITLQWLCERSRTFLHSKNSFIAGIHVSSPAFLERSLGILILLLGISQYAQMCLAGRDGIPYYQEAYMNGWERKKAEFLVAAYLKSHYDGKPVLMDVSEHGIIPQQTGIHLIQFINETVFGLWDEGLAEPSHFADWVIVQKDDSCWKTLEKSQDLKEHFKLVFQAETPLERAILVFRKLTPPVGTLLRDYYFPARAKILGGSIHLSLPGMRGGISSTSILQRPAFLNGIKALSDPMSRWEAIVPISGS